MEGIQAFSTALQWLWCLCGAAALGGAGFLALRGRRWLEPSGSRWILWTPRVFWGVLVPGSFVAFKLAQYASFELTLDSGVVANVTWNAAHGHGLWSSVYGGETVLESHFEWTYYLFAPLIRLFPSSALLAAVLAGALGFCPSLAYLLGRRLGERRWIGWAAGALALSNPLLSSMLRDELNLTLLAPFFFLWAVYWWESGLKKESLLPVLLLIGTREIIPFLLFGFGLWLFTQARSRRECWTAAALLGASALLWPLELALISHARRDLPVQLDYWRLYGGLGGSAPAVLGTLLRRPHRFLAALAWPPEKLWTPARVLLAFGLLPLASGPALLPAALTWLPHQLADAGTPFQRLAGPYGAFLYGPLVWACVRGMRALALSRHGRRPDLLAAWALSVSALGFFAAGPGLLPEGALPRAWAAEGEAALAAVPASASVWGDRFFLAHLGMRRYLKGLPSRPAPSYDSVIFESGLFLPDRVLLSRHWVRQADPACRSRILEYLRQRGFREAFNGRDQVVLANPLTAGREGGEPEWIRLP